MKAPLPPFVKRAVKEFAARVLEGEIPAAPLPILAGGMGMLAARLLEKAAAIEWTTVPLALPFSNMTRENWQRALELWLAHGVPLLEALPGRACPACATPAGRFLFSSYDGYPFHECVECGSWFVPKHVDQSLFDRFFDRCPDARSLAETMADDRGVASRQQGDIERIGPQLDEVLSLLRSAQAPIDGYLDVGCGVGHSLEAAAERGLSAVGLEVDPACIELARSRGLDVHPTPGAFTTRRFSLVSLWETLEHLAQPRAVLEQAHQLLNDRGLLVLTTPNLNSPIVRILRGDCSYVHGGTNTAGHINLFHPKSLERLLASAGFAVLDVDAQYSNNPFEIASHLRGWARGAHDMAFRAKNTVEVPRLLEAFFNATWPCVAQLERILLSAPILKVLACRKDAAESFSEGIGALRSRRRHEILGQLPLPWKALPELTRWRVSEGAATAGKGGIEVRGDGSAHGPRLTSSRIGVVPARKIVVSLPVTPRAGHVTVGILDHKGDWLLDPRALGAAFSFDSGANRSVRLVVSVQPSGKPPVSLAGFAVEPGRYADLGPTSEC